ncbi:HAD family phosphatase [Lutibacter sp. A80]|uniref:HAD family hydrolase n=1 Tax=Lutibacter sp. A80 TaxID=2918453 RepID=UPI001F06194E|nr:HAD family phosphatase [Lutibacter sp. A80]UMB61466.1 HAD family phosphatase [Lutibacter sp. A80]
MKAEIDTIIFDLGGVLVDWKPEYLYRKIFNGDEQKVQWFLNNVCTPQWNIEQDAGRTIAEANAIKIAEFPEYEKEIISFYKRWDEMFSGPIKENLQLFKKLKASKKYKIYALTNWSAEKWEVGIKLFPFFNDFDGVIVSGKVKLIKPFPEIYKLILNTYNITPEKAIFIDDNKKNVLTANNLNINGIHYTKELDLINKLKDLKINTNNI